MERSRESVRICASCWPHSSYLTQVWVSWAPGAVTALSYSWGRQLRASVPQRPAFPQQPCSVTACMWAVRGWVCNGDSRQFQTQQLLGKLKAKRTMEDSRKHSKVASQSHWYPTSKFHPTKATSFPTINIDMIRTSVTSGKEERTGTEAMSHKNHLDILLQVMVDTSN